MFIPLKHYMCLFDSKKADPDIKLNQLSFHILSYSSSKVSSRFYLWLSADCLVGCLQDCSIVLLMAVLLAVLKDVLLVVLKAIPWVVFLDILAVVFRYVKLSWSLVLQFLKYLFIQEIQFFSFFSVINIQSLSKNSSICFEFINLFRINSYSIWIFSWRMWKFKITKNSSLIYIFTMAWFFDASFAIFHLIEISMIDRYSINLQHDRHHSIFSAFVCNSDFTLTYDSFFPVLISWYGRFIHILCCFSTFQKRHKKDIFCSFFYSINSKLAFETNLGRPSVIFALKYVSLIFSLVETFTFKKLSFS